MNRDQGLTNGTNFSMDLQAQQGANTVGSGLQLGNLAKNNALNTFQDVGASSKIDKGTQQDNDKLGESISKAISAQNKDSGANKEDDSKAASDERMKELFGEESGASLVDCIAKLNAYRFKYKPEFQGKPGVDGDTHVGVMAQELEKNEATPNVVEEDVDGLKMVNTKELTLSNTAIISELAQRLLQLEDEVRSLKGGK